MVFSTSIFLLLFLPLFLLVYELTPKKLKNYTLLAASILFYAWGAPKFIFVLIGFSVINYFVVNLLSKQTEEKKRKFFLTLSVTLNLLLLIVFKYANFFVHSINDVLTALGMTAFYWKEIALPIGISFFIFQSITYCVDVFRKESLPARNYANYLLYIISFPQLIAGPIVRYKTIAAEIEDRRATYDDKLIGFYRFSIGLAKKAIIANFMAMQADMLFNGSVSLEKFMALSTTEAWLGVVAFTFQIYFDFSGYSDMAIGLGRMMGFHYPENFNNPYISKSVSEFWKRWHITLGDFMMNYLYIPLGGNRTKTKARHYLNLWIVFLLSGLWHGAAWNFLFWGAFHGIFIVLDKMGFQKLLKRLGTLPSVIITFFIVMVVWSVFAVDSMEKWWYLAKAMFAFRDLNTFMIEPIFIPMIFIAVFFAFFFELTPLKKVQNFFFYKDNYTNRQHIFVFTLMLLLFVISVAHVTASGFNPFIYFRF
ncbi:MAG: MBOAT family protein [Bacteroidales bacterium]|nr:MBOAT family protein [Bacteroidales bacterium]